MDVQFWQSAAGFLMVGFIIVTAVLWREAKAHEKTLEILFTMQCSCDETEA